MTPRLRAVVVTGAMAVGATLLAAALLALGPVSVHLGNNARNAGDPVTAEQHYDMAARWLWTDRWMVPFNRGIIRHDLARFDDAAADFEAAATLAPPEHQCIVRLNWAWTLEAAADELVLAGEVSSASARYLHADAVLVDAVCADEPGTQWERTRERLENRRTGSVTPPREPDPAADQPSAQEQELTDRQTQAQQEFREAGENRDRPPVADGERTW